MESITTLQQALRQAQLAQYGRLRGGFPVLLGGAVYWAAVGGMFWAVRSGLMEEGWAYFLTLFGTGAIFPMALGFAKISGINFMKDRSPVGSVLFPAFVAMLLFWPMLLGAIHTGANSMVLLILAIGLSLHFPVIGWSYGRSLLFCAYAVIRAICVYLAWYLWPEQQQLYVPAIVCASYLIMALIVFVDSGRVRSASPH
ncbi:DUF7010 family protein [Parvularcula sp. LCG005]|uniref:DUF7010 family protein n=1 Tax=Parvularcula sp. LCG005 TaxID=3078805 RepID=UPI0029439450|nr:hypothetical protein [Parvularcula sp. LCG005]WOI53355.1 hypothetical protein RUI03_14515 [Parvularcula sp. LCG005]